MPLYLIWFLPKYFCTCATDVIHHLIYFKQYFIIQYIYHINGWDTSFDAQHARCIKISMQNSCFSFKKVYSLSMLIGKLKFNDTSFKSLKKKIKKAISDPSNQPLSVQPNKEKLKIIGFDRLYIKTLY